MTPTTEAVIIANLALLDGEFDTPARKGAPFQGASKTVINAAISYEKTAATGRSSRATTIWTRFG